MDYYEDKVKELSEKEKLSFIPKSKPFVPQSNFEISKEIVYEKPNGIIKFRTLHNDKHRLATVFIRYKTKQKRLLYTLLQIFINQRQGISYGTTWFITDATCSTEGIVFKTHDVYTLGITALLQYFLTTYRINTYESDTAGYGDFNELCHDIASFSVLITGKCKLTQTALTSKSSRKMQTFVRLMKKYYDEFIVVRNERNDEQFFMANRFVPEETKLSKPLSDLEKMMFVVCFGSLPYIINNDSIIALNYTVMNLLKEKNLTTNSKTFRFRIRKFQDSFGVINSTLLKPKSKAAKLRGDILLASMNMLCEIYSTLHGFSFKFNSLKELHEINEKALKAIRSIQFKLPYLTGSFYEKYLGRKMQEDQNEKQK